MGSQVKYNNQCEFIDIEAVETVEAVEATINQVQQELNEIWERLYN